MIKSKIMYITILVWAITFIAGLTNCNLVGGKKKDNDNTSLTALLALAASSPRTVYMYADTASGVGYDGNLGGRSGADSKCASARTSGLTCTNIRAWISVSTADSIKNMPSLYGVPTSTNILSPTGIVIATSYSGLTDGTISDASASKNLQGADLFSGVTTPYWWAGTTAADGTGSDTANDNCSGWTTNSAAVTGGPLDATTPNGSLFGVETDPCNNTKQVTSAASPHAILCLCW